MIDRLREFVAVLVMRDAQTIADDDELLLSGVLDSMAIAQLILFIAEEFSIDVPPEDIRIENFQTLAKIAGYLDQ
jgi:methoxymalonate biosynthesis acyl carrier protein